MDSSRHNKISGEGVDAPASGNVNAEEGIVTFQELDCVALENSALSLLVTRSVGPRIISLRPVGGPNLFAELPDVTLPYPGEGVFHLWGGHRLWHAPEAKRRTYIPDDRPPTIEQGPGELRVTAPTEPETGLQKKLRITLPDAGATVVVDHTLHNRGLWPVKTAPWAITQLRSGGVALLPQPTGPADPDGVQPNRTLVLWPYTDIRSPFIRWGNRLILIRSTPKTGPLKVGFANPRGWLAYYYHGTLFVKRAEYDDSATYFDRGSSSQCYCNPSFLELETLGPKTELAPGASVTHREVWEVYRHYDLDLELMEAETEPILAELDLDATPPYLEE